MVSYVYHWVSQQPLDQFTEISRKAGWRTQDFNIGRLAFTVFHSFKMAIVCMSSLPKSLKSCIFVNQYTSELGWWVSII